ncbi:MAG: Sodium/hydrogen exchanger family protein [bacterium ADurb.Bin478]|nr:MAG: Sodium/hydrogen exchanger family protein [bacterium ADurb.Bin478]
MQPDSTPMVIGIFILLSSMISLRTGLSVAIIEITAGIIAGNMGIQTEDWMLYLAGFGGILLTYLAGTEIDTQLMREKFKECFLIGVASFLLPFLLVYLYTYYISHWTLPASLLAGTALSTTSLAVVYSVLIETGLARTEIGKLLMASTFVTDMGTAIAMSILFVKPSIYTLIFLSISINVIYFADKFTHYFFNHPRWKDKVVEPEIKYIFVLLLVLMYFANFGEGHAVLPAFILGLLMSKHFKDSSGSRLVRNRLRTVAYALITPIFFIVGGLRVSLPLIATGGFLFLMLFAIKIAGKFFGTYYLAKKYIPGGSMYTTLLMSTGLTFGTIASVFGLNSGLIDRQQYSILVGVVIASAIIPTFIAQKWFMPVHSEDLVEFKNGGK